MKQGPKMTKPDIDVTILPSVGARAGSPPAAVLMDARKACAGKGDRSRTIEMRSSDAAGACRGAQLQPVSGPARENYSRADSVRVINALRVLHVPS